MITNNSLSVQRNARMNSIFPRLGLSLLATLLAPHALAATLQSLDVAALPGDRVELRSGQWELADRDRTVVGRNLQPRGEGVGVEFLLRGFAGRDPRLERLRVVRQFLGDVGRVFRARPAGDAAAGTCAGAEA